MSWQILIYFEGIFYAKHATIHGRTGNGGKGSMDKGIGDLEIREKQEGGKAGRTKINISGMKKITKK